MTRSDAEKFHCTFCNRSQDEVTRIVAGLDHKGVCDECLPLLITIMAENHPAWREEQIKALENKRGDRG